MLLHLQLSASSLDVDDALQIFGLTMHDTVFVNFKPSTKDMLAVPDELST
jgi:ribosomal protein L30/L7E